MTSNIDRGHSGTKRRNRNRPTPEQKNGKVYVTVDQDRAEFIHTNVLAGYTLDHVLGLAKILYPVRDHRDV